jgi:hypothetical protein
MKAFVMAGVIHDIGKITLPMGVTVAFLPLMVRLGCNIFHNEIQWTQRK